MQAYSKSNLAAYQSAAAHGGVAASDPHGLIVLLMDGALERIATARGCMQRGETAEKVRLRIEKALACPTVSEFGVYRSVAEKRK